MRRSSKMISSFLALRERSHSQESELFNIIRILTNMTRGKFSGGEFPSRPLKTSQNPEKTKT